MSIVEVDVQTDAEKKINKYLRENFNRFNES